MEIPFRSEFFDLAPWLTIVFWGQNTWVPTWWNDTTSPPNPSSLLTFQRYLEVHKPHASPSLSTNNAAGLACSSPVAGDLRLTWSCPPLEYFQTKLGLTQHTLPSRKRQHGGESGQEKRFPFSHSTKQSFMKGTDFVPPLHPPWRRYRTLPSRCVPTDVGPWFLQTDYPCDDFLGGKVTHAH